MWQLGWAAWQVGGQLNNQPCLVTCYPHLCAQCLRRESRGSTITNNYSLSFLALCRSCRFRDRALWKREGQQQQCLNAFNLSCLSLPSTHEHHHHTRCWVARQGGLMTVCWYMISAFLGQRSVFYGTLTTNMCMHWMKSLTV
jgi:hypothetical protein